MSQAKAKRSNNTVYNKVDDETVTVIDAVMVTLDEIEEIENKLKNLRAILRQAIKDNNLSMPPEFNIKKRTASRAASCVF